LSLFRTSTRASKPRHARRTPASARLKLAIGGPALALALAGGVAGTWAATSGGTPASGLASTGRSVALDAYGASANSPDVSGGGGTGGSGGTGGAHTPKGIARQMLGHFHWSQRQFKYLDWLWNRESSWNVYALNPTSSAYGIPQAVPGSKMASAGPNWQSNARTQIRWGLRYIKSRYGSPAAAWDHEVNQGWY
jgi:resuscitation-promoting factor RpfB